MRKKYIDIVRLLSDEECGKELDTWKELGDEFKIIRPRVIEAKINKKYSRILDKKSKDKLDNVLKAIDDFKNVADDDLFSKFGNRRHVTELASVFYGDGESKKDVRETPIK